MSHGKVANVAYLETVCSAAQVWSIWSLGLVAEDFVEGGRSQRRFQVGRRGEGVEAQ